MFRGGGGIPLLINIKHKFFYFSQDMQSRAFFVRNYLLGFNIAKLSK